MKKKKMLMSNKCVLSNEQLSLIKAGSVKIASQSGAPGAGVNIRVRGIGSVNAGNDPLFIIDN
ncbi:MAG TPA: hypothetical protein DCS93_25745 [Microscillaceae bacterium]|nr:hypothetical protein [Microscillaceae bacterium]